MKFPAPYVRKAFGGLLAGNVSYNSTSVPVYEGEAVKLDQPFIIIGNYTHTRVPNKCKFSYEAQQAIEIITVKYDPAAKIADAITELVMTLVDDADNDLSTADFSIYVMGETVGVIREDSISNQKVFRRLITYNLNIEEK